MGLVINAATCSGTGQPVRECNCDQHRNGRGNGTSLSDEDRKPSLAPPTINFSEQAAPTVNAETASDNSEAIPLSPAARAMREGR